MKYVSHCGWFLLWLLLVSDFATGQDEKGRFIEDEYEPAGSHLLRWDLKPGQQFKVEASQEVISETVGPLGSFGKVPTAITVWQDWEVTERTKIDLKGNSLTPITYELVIVQTIRRIQFKTTPPGLSRIVVDSEQPSPDDVIAKQIHANISDLVGQRVQMQMDHRGQVKKYHFIEEQTEAGETPAPARQNPSKESVRNIVGQMVQFPETTARPGRIWETSLKSNLPNGTSTIKTEYTFLGPLDDQPERARVKILPQVEFASKDGSVTLENQTSEGFLLYDLKRRVVRETEIKQTLSFSFGGDAPGKQHFETSVRMKIDPSESDH